MKALPNRKGNGKRANVEAVGFRAASMKALPNRKGNTHSSIAAPTVPVRLNESPSKEEGKSSPRRVVRLSQRIASMKALPNRKGNADPEDLSNPTAEASMKVPPKRKGNPAPHP